MYNYYDKSVIEPYALKIISKSYDSKYSHYTSPVDTDNFDFISPDGKEALEVSLIISQNEREAYIYEKEKYLNNKSVSSNKIKGVKVDENGKIKMYSGTTIHQTCKLIFEGICKKEVRVLKRLKNYPECSVELCLCIQDGGMLDKFSFELYIKDLGDSIFNRFFFITCSLLIVYDKVTGYVEYELSK